MFRKAVPLIVIVVLVLSSLVIVAMFNARPTKAQTDNMNMRAFIQSLVDQNQEFTINTRVTNFVVDGEHVKVSQLGDDFVCVAGELNVMGNSKTMICDTFSMIIILVP
jgi:hypothetical protein